METIIQVHKEGKFFVAVDMVTNVADQGRTEKEAIRRLKKGLESHYRVLLELMPKSHKVSLMDVGVEKYAKISRSVS
jgi:predicted RNase H-like HicB family nuclease